MFLTYTATLAKYMQRCLYVIKSNIEMNKQEYNTFFILKTHSWQLFGDENNIFSNSVLKAQ